MPKGKHDPGKGTITYFIHAVLTNEPRLDGMSSVIDGIKLVNLIDVVCNNDYSLRITDALGKLSLDGPLPPLARVKGIQCSTANISEADNTLLFILSH